MWVCLIIQLDLSHAYMHLPTFPLVNSLYPPHAPKRAGRCLNKSMARAESSSSDSVFLALALSLKDETTFVKDFRNLFYFEKSVREEKQRSYEKGASKVQPS